MEYQRKPQRPAPATRQASTHTPDPPAPAHLEERRRTLQRFTARPQTARCHRAEGLEGQRLDARAFGKFQTLQRQVAQTLDHGFRCYRKY
ncbi:hypothetical protein [Deinococcus sp. 23YEL01]|uniref:hypothetical protein n=1 Tax=Deinococcus sp. 23YEL01 TaxID=2745871 RepID=UPI001E47485A|nr:hypothetical protein [Deinococcus sp. 23YEL01]MCD0170591.1 hypothetical protein [Deinococcus sp. 23YEL01]